MAEFKILEQKEDCVLLMRQMGKDVKYLVKDIENDVIYMSINNPDGAKKAFDDYDLEKIKEERRRLFTEWLKEFAES